MDQLQLIGDVLQTGPDHDGKRLFLTLGPLALFLSLFLSLAVVICLY